ncbi:alkaline phosphatase [Dethiothermospora halolimnae]|uniref:alkaline phosphatase n=1 Tax=Dethiothermospora halolimnae TaxID=3114390 RepID=UPI003CCBA36C
MDIKKYLSKGIIAVLFLALIFSSFTITSNDITKGNVVEASGEKSPKYVFYFVGDGLGASQRQFAEIFLQEKTGDKSKKLLINSLPVAGINTTYSSDSLITDSAAAGTALATGHKTNNKVISQTPDGRDLKTLVEGAEEKGMATGIITSTRLTHATPATFASHNESRYNANEIAEEYLDSGVEFFAGGGYRHFVPEGWKWGKSKREDSRNLLEEFSQKGYKVFESDNKTEDFRNYIPNKEDKVIATFDYSHLPYEIDRVNDNKTPSLAEITQKGIDVLSKYKDGFFMMVEGGRIDHACHANDPVGAIHDTLAFDNAVKKAYDFYKKHPKETLIVVVGDHETGGMGLGFGNGYFLDMKPLLNAKVSIADTVMGAYTNQFDNDREKYLKYISEKLRLNDLTESEKSEIEKAMDIVDNKDEERAKVYGGYDPVGMATAHVVSERANIQWTTYAHSGTQIPMSAVGVGAENFSGYKDNTEIAKTMARLLSITLD